MSRQKLGAVLGTSLVLVGCGGPSGAPDGMRAMVVPVSGKVLTADGRPVANGWVVFNPKDVPGHEANAPTNPDGSFRLSTFAKEDGAIPGRYVVTVEPHPYPKGSKPSIPRRYVSDKDSPLTVEIKKGGDVELEPFRLR
ncbi:MAG TPA: carboxypeptidase-like regulatory domain-containing protein [Gemmataceae bacterium]|jgi:hypothetical protein|nr:carboxypeptidase-like regulatory domain-containing protein [Gemmataceae bacterium]